MATQKDRINTILAIINSNVALSSVNVNKLRTEFRQVIEVDVVNPGKRKNILKILHSTRALDSTLKSIVDYHRIGNGKNSIGAYIAQFALHANGSLGRLSQSEKAKYQRTIANVRNIHMHTADSYPRNDSDVYELISEMQSLITRVTSL